MTTPLPAPTINKPVPNSTVKSPVIFEGKGAAGATLSLKVDVESETTIVDASGNWRMSRVLAPRDYIAAAFLMVDGEYSPPTGPLNITVD